MSEVAPAEARRSVAGFQEGATGVVPPINPGRRGSFLSDVITELGFADGEMVEEAVQKAREPGVTVGEVLLSLGALDDEQLAQATAERNGLDYVRLGEFDVDFDAAGLISRSVAQRYGAVPIAFATDGALILAMEDPTDMLAISDVEVMTRGEVRTAVAGAGAIAELIERVPESQKRPPMPPPVAHENGAAADAGPSAEVEQNGAPEAEHRSVAPPAPLESPPQPDPHEGGADPRVEAELDELRARIAEVEAERDQARREAAAAETERDQARDQVAAVEIERDRAREEATASQAEADAPALDEELEAATAERERLREQIGELEAERDRLQERIAEVEAERDQARQEAAEAAAEADAPALDEELEAAIAEQDRLRLQIAEVEAERDRARDEITALEAERDRAREEVTVAESERDRVRVQVSLAEAERDGATGEREELRKRIAELEAEHERLEYEASTANTGREMIFREAQRLAQELKRLEASQPAPQG